MLTIRRFAAAVLVCASAAWAQFTPATPESQGIPTASLEEIGGIVQGFIDKDYAVGGELLVIKNRHVVFQQAYGMADRESGRAWQNNDVCNIRSMTKMITGAAAQILIDRGKLGLDEPVAKYLPGFDNERSRGITVRQVLTHRSGLPLTILTSVDEYPDLISQANAAGEHGPDFEPGSKFWYSDAGADVVGALVEVCSGEKLDMFVTRELLEPLGMSDSLYGINADDPRMPRVASLYAGAAGAWVRYWQASDKPFYPFAWGSQTVYSTPIDYAKFLAMWMDGGRSGEARLLSSEAVARTLEPVSPMSMLGSDERFPTDYRGLEVYYGQMSVLYCPEEDPQSGAVIISHSGSDGTMAWAWPKLDLMVLYFTQSRGGTTVLRLESAIDRLLIHPGEAIVEAEVPEAMKPLIGTYVANFGTFENEEFVVRAKEGKLVLDIPSQMAFELREPDDQGRWAFALAPDQVQVSFELSEVGTAELLKLHQGGTTFDVPRKGTALAEEMSKPIVIAPEVLESVVGNYHDPETDRIIEIFIDETGALGVKAPPNLVFQLRPVRDAELTWLVKQNPAVSLSFQRDEDGRIVSMTRLIGAASLVMPRQE